MSRSPVSIARQLRDFAIGALIAILIATAAFVAVRNHEVADKQTDLATRAVDALADGNAPPPTVHAVIVGAPQPSQKNPYLQQRQVYDAGSWRPLTAKGSSDDKLFFDLANKLERTAPRSVGELAGAHAQRVRRVAAALERRDARLASALAAQPIHAAELTALLRDGSGRAIAVRPIEDTTLLEASGYLRPTHPDVRQPDTSGSIRMPRQELAIAVTPPAEPAPYPWLVMIGVLGLGLALAAAGALLSGPRGRGAQLGTFLGVSVIAVPCMLWRAPIATTAIAVLAASLALAQGVNLTDRIATGFKKHRVALGFLAPAAISMFVLVAAPFIIGLVIGFYDHHQGQWTFVGLDNFGEILSGGGRPLDDPLNFWFILGVTVLWTVLNVVFHVTIGVALAFALSRSWLRGRGVLRMLFILPWAIPNYITALIWKGIFVNEDSAISTILDWFGLDHVNWIGSWLPAFSANVITNTWLGFPFMMVVALGALETIPKELYEAASVDGASAWQRFRHITLPHLRPALGPAVALGSIWTFNMFNVIFLVSGGNPGGSTNILVTDAYRWAFERGERYGMAAAYGTIIFLILLLWTVFGTRLVRSKGDDA
jgi:ABC-type sugar transport system permease subunit